MAAPHVAGGAVLYKSRYRSATPLQVKTALRAAATLGWSKASDPDGTPDRLLDVGML